MELEVKPDYDGEERVLVLELVMNLDIRVWKEQEISMLEDVYSLKKEIIPVCTGVTLHHISVKNDSQCRLTEQMELAESQEKILQICSCEGTVHLESTELTGQGVRAEGILVTELLYITTDDQMPIGSAREIYPFEQLIEIPQQTARTERNKPEELEALERKNKLQTELDCRISQLSAVMLDQDHVEIKAVIGLDLLAFEQEQIDNITDTCVRRLWIWSSYRSVRDWSVTLQKMGIRFGVSQRRITQRWKIFCGIITGRMRICAEGKKF